jgi:hypothetical protein
MRLNKYTGAKLDDLMKTYLMSLTTITRFSETITLLLPRDAYNFQSEWVS